MEEHQDHNSHGFIAAILAVMSTMLFLFLRPGVKWIGFFFLAFAAYYFYQHLQSKKS